MLTFAQVKEVLGLNDVRSAGASDCNHQPL